MSALDPCIIFEALGDPKGQPRPRAFSLNGVARIYDAGTAEGWKSQIALAAKPYIPFTPLKGPLRLNLMFRFRRPLSHFRSNGMLHSKHTLVQHCQKPDFDNLEKAVVDAMGILKFWEDDAQVCECHTWKAWATDDQMPGAIITLQALTSQEKVEALPLFKQKKEVGV
jgi:Holliday junction resolvase RusA-like endonuclease